MALVRVLFYQKHLVYCGIAISCLYYYFLLFNQINDQINMIYQKSKWFLTFLHRIRLSILIDKHNLLAIQIYEINLVWRRSLLVFYIKLFQVSCRSHIDWMKKGTNIILHIRTLLTITVSHVFPSLWQSLYAFDLFKHIYKTNDFVNCRF